MAKVTFLMIAGGSCFLLLMFAAKILIETWRTRR